MLLSPPVREMPPTRSPQESERKGDEGSGAVVSGWVEKKGQEPGEWALKTEFRDSGLPGQGESGEGQFPGESRDGA